MYGLYDFTNVTSSLSPAFLLPSRARGPSRTILTRRLQLATLRGWTLEMAVSGGVILTPQVAAVSVLDAALSDTIWGCCLCAAAAVVGALATSWEQS
jgi:hypothetical protein